MNTLLAPTFGAENHPAGQIVPPTRRTVADKVNALVGYRVDWLLQGTSVSIVPTDDCVTYYSAS